MTSPKNTEKALHSADEQATKPSDKKQNRQSKSAKEIGGPKGPEPTRYGDWEHKGRCIDF